MAIKGRFPTIRPSLDLNFAKTKRLDPRITFTRASSGTYVGRDGLIKTAGVNEARFDYSPTTGESLGLLVEEARTNSITNNTMVGAVVGTPGTSPTGWIYATASSNGLTLSIVGTGTENGINYIDYRFNGTTVASPNSCAIGFVNAAAATGQTWTASMYWKLAAGSATGATNWQLGLIESTAGGSFVTGAFYSQTAPTSAALNTQRPAATRTLSGGATIGLVTYPLNVAVAGNTAIDFTLRIGLPQLEQGAFATSAIQTSTAAATRSADLASITGTAFSSWYRQDEGTVFAEARSIASAGSERFPLIIQGATFNDRWVVGVATTNQYQTFYVVGGAAQANLTVGSLTDSSVFRIASTAKINDIAMSANGGALQLDASASLITASEIGIGRAAQYLNGTIRRLTYWPQRLSNATLQALTS